jgi:hypothetical protein
VLEYAQLMKAMQGGIDALTVFAAFGMDVGAWTACAQRWMAVMTTRPDVAMRFAALLGAPWS